MKYICLVLSLLLCSLASNAQRMPSNLQNPVSSDLQRDYRSSYVRSRIVRAGTYASLGATALGIGMMEYTSDRLASYAPDELNEGGTMLLLFECLFTAGSFMSATGFLTGDVVLNRRLNTIQEHNDFLLQSGNTERMWRYARAERLYENSRKAMKINGIATGLFALYSTAGLAAYAMNPSSDFIYRSTASAMYMSAFSATAFLASWLINGQAKRKMNTFAPLPVSSVKLSPFVVPSPVGGGSSAVGLSLTFALE